MSAKYTENNLGEIPDECVIHISKYLEPRELPELRVINKRIYDNLKKYTYLELNLFSSAHYVCYEEFRNKVHSRIEDPRNQIKLQLKYVYAGGVYSVLFERDHTVPFAELPYLSSIRQKVHCVKSLMIINACDGHRAIINRCNRLLE
jgi:hypothetical protein